MPIERYRHVGEVPAPANADVTEVALLERLADTWAFAADAAGPLFQPGVHRYASLEAADAAREAALQARVRRLARVDRGGDR